MAQLEVFFGSDCQWVVGPYLFHRGVLVWLGCFSVMVHCVGWMASVRAGRFLCFNSSRI